MTYSDTLVSRSALAILEEITSMIRGLGDEPYRALGGQGASIGQHTRHTLDHFTRIVGGHRTGTPIDYDHRDRGGAVETDRSAALSEIAGLIAVLSALDEEDLGTTLSIRVMVNAEGDEAEMPSTLVRELWFATHHAFHHNALIKSIAHELGHTLPPTFGRAPSTVHSEQRAAH